MRFVAVLDLMGGRVVHARRGQRAAYQPLQSRLVAGCDPVTVACALVRAFPISTLYVADLDAILGEGDQRAAVRAIAEALPGVELWLDCGAGSVAAFGERHGDGRTRAVLGSETLQDLQVLTALRRSDASFVLSLDFRGGDFLGPAALLDDATLWPEEVIAMNLECVGSEGGPDLDLVTRLRARAPTARIYGAGGVRNASDVAALRRVGAAGVLLATALHTSLLSTTDLQSASGRGEH